MTNRIATIILPPETHGWGENKRVTPIRHVRVELNIDVDRILRHLTQKAARSKTKRTLAMSGMVKLKVLDIKEIK